MNNRETKTVVGNELVTRKWKDIKVGDTIQLENNEFVTVRISFSIIRNKKIFLFRLILYLYQQVNQMAFVLLKQLN